jgi:Tfp pilus assembly PilM family ATPase
MRTTLNISSREIRLAGIEGETVRKWNIVQLSPGLVRDGHILAPQEVGVAIASMLRSTGLSGNRVWLTVSGLSFTYRILELPRTKRSLLEEAVVRAVRREISLPLEELYLSWQIMDRGGDTVTVFALGIPRALIDDIIRTMKVAGVRLAALDLKSLALARAAGSANAVIVDFEPDCYEIVVVARGVPSILHSVVPRLGSAVIEDSVRSLIDELSRTVNFYNITHPDAPLSPRTPLLFTGSLSTNDEIKKLVQAGTEYPIETLTTTFKHPADFPVSHFISNLGLAQKGAVRAIVPRGNEGVRYDINLDLLGPARQAMVEKSRRRDRILPFAVAALVLLLVPGYLMRNGAISETARLQAHLERVTRELRLARLTADAAADTETSIIKILEDIDMLQQQRDVLLGGDTDTAADLQAVAETIKKLGYIQRVEVNPGEMTIECHSPDRNSVFSYVRALEKLGRFAEVRISFLDETGNGETGPGAPVKFNLVILR